MSLFYTYKTGQAAGQQFDTCPVTNSHNSADEMSMNSEEYVDQMDVSEHLASTPKYNNNNNTTPAGGHSQLSPVELPSRKINLEASVGDSLFEQFCNMKLKEQNQPITYHEGTWFKKYRRILVDWISEVVAELQLDVTTTHAAVCYMDAYLHSQKAVPRKRLQLVATACILIASKMEEKEDDLPSVAELNDCTDGAYSHDLIRQMELHALMTIGWDVNCNTTAAHFLAFYKKFQESRVSYADLLHNGAITDIPHVQCYVERYADFFVSLSLQEYDFNRFPRSMVASSAIACAREAIGVTPFWTPALEALTGYSFFDIESCCSFIWNAYSLEFKDGPIRPKAVASSPVNAMHTVNALVDDDDDSSYVLE